MPDLAGTSIVITFGFTSSLLTLEKTLHPNKIISTPISIFSTVTFVFVLTQNEGNHQKIGQNL